LLDSTEKFAGTWITGGEPSKSLKLLSVIADANGVPQRSANAHTANNHLNLVLGDPLLKAL
jgi:hypothetical protein